MTRDEFQAKALALIDQDEALRDAQLALARVVSLLGELEAEAKATAGAMHAAAYFNRDLLHGIAARLRAALEGK